MSEPNLTTRAKILQQLKAGPSTAKAIAQVCGHEQEHGVASALNAMAAKGVVVKLKAKPGQAAKFRLKSKKLDMSHPSIYGIPTHRVASGNAATRQDGALLGGKGGVS